jgi:hypothetical protein
VLIILSVSLDRALSDVGGALQLLHHLPDQPGSVCVSFRRDGSIFQPIFSSLISGNEVLNFVSKTSDVIGIG